MPTPPPAYPSRPDASPSGASPERLGPHVLLRQLHRDLHGELWLARSALMIGSKEGEREHLLRVLPLPSFPAVADGIVSSARAAAELSHPNLVGVRSVERLSARDGGAASTLLVAYEAFEGRSLADWLQENDGMPVRQSVLVMLGLLDALAHAHESGLLHGHLDPGAVWLDATGRARLINVGLARPGALDPLAHPPGPVYQAPEVIAGDAPGQTADVFCAALLLYELMYGQPVAVDPNASRAFARLRDLDVALPRPGPVGLDDALRGVLAQALSRDRERRTVGARIMREALQRWLTPVSTDASAASKSEQTMNLLTRRLEASELPAHRHAMREVRRLASADRVNASEVARAARDDVAFTLRLLRQVNAAYYTAYHQGTGQGGVNTVSRAVALMGFASVRDLAGGLAAVEDMKPPARSAALMAEYRRARLAGQLAARLCPTALEEEETHIAAMLYNLGRILVTCYLPEEAGQIRQLTIANGGSEATAAMQVLGWDFDTLSLNVANAWGLAEGLVRALRRLPASTLVRPPSRREEWIRVLANLGVDLADAMIVGPQRQRAARITAVVDRYHHALGLASADVWTAVDACAELVPAPGADAATEAQTQARASNAEQAAHRLSEAILTVRRFRDEQAGQVDARLILQTVSQAIAQALPCRYVALCLQRSRSEEIVAREVVGPQPQRLLDHVRFDLAHPQDVFSAVCLRGADTLIKDTTVPSIATRLPPWFREHVQASSFLLLPWVTRRAGMETPVGAIYVDTEALSGLSLSDRELSLIRSLRDESLLALTVAAQPFAGTRY